MGMFAVGSVLATLNTPWAPLNGDGFEPDASEKAVSGPLTIPAAYGWPLPNWSLVSGNPLLNPVAATYVAPMASGSLAASGTKFHCPAVSVPDVTVLPGTTVPCWPLWVCHSANGCGDVDWPEPQTHHQ